MTLDLTDDEVAALVKHLRHALEYDPFPFAPRSRPAESDPCQAGSASTQTRTAAALAGERRAAPTRHPPALSAIAIPLMAARSFVDSNRHLP
jgi:hypothetical protein